MFVPVSRLLSVSIPIPICTMLPPVIVRLLPKPRQLLDRLLPRVVIAEALGAVGEGYDDEEEYDD